MARRIDNDRCWHNKVHRSGKYSLFILTAGHRTVRNAGTTFVVAVGLHGSLAMMVLRNGAVIARAAVHRMEGPRHTGQGRKQRGDGQQAHPSGQSLQASWIWAVH
jgi:hypothetical protein